MSYVEIFIFCVAIFLIGISYLRGVVGKEKSSSKGNVFVHFMKSFLGEVKLWLEKSNQKYKDNVDKCKRHHIF